MSAPRQSARLYAAAAMVSLLVAGVLAAGTILDVASRDEELAAYEAREREERAARGGELEEEGAWTEGAVDPAELDDGAWRETELGELELEPVGDESAWAEPGEPELDIELADDESEWSETGLTEEEAAAEGEPVLEQTPLESDAADAPIEERIASLRDLIARRAEGEPAESSGDALDESVLLDGPPLDEIELASDIFDAEPVLDEEVGPVLDLALPWHYTARTIALAVLGLALGGLLLVLHRRERDARHAAAGATILAWAAGALLVQAMASPTVTMIVLPLSTPLWLVALAFVLLASRRRRALLLSALLGAELLRLGVEQLYVMASIRATPPSLGLELAHLGLAAAPWAAVSFVLFEDARARRAPRPRSGEGPYREAPAALEREQAWRVPRAAIAAMAAWLAALALVRLGAGLERSWDLGLSRYAYIADLMLAIATAVAAVRAADREVRAWLGVTAGLLFVLPALAAVTLAQRAFHGSLHDWADLTVASELGQAIFTVMLAAAAGAAARAFASFASSRATEAAARPALNAAEVALLVAAAAAVPWVLRFPSEWIAEHMVWPLLATLVAAGAMLFASHLRRLSAWLEAASEPPADASD